MFTLLRTRSVPESLDGGGPVGDSGMGGYKLLKKLLGPGNNDGYPRLVVC